MNQRPLEFSGALGAEIFWLLENLDEVTSGQMSVFESVALH